ncbi:hypothetical protein FKM82_000096 [Ascaphus truei]
MQSSQGDHYYRMLRMFSGVHPTPANEDDFESWIEQAMRMWPTLAIVRAIREGNEARASGEYLQALEHTFGTTESGEELYLHFKGMFQEGEKLSNFLRRFEGVLLKVVRNKGVTSDRIHCVQVEQLIRGVPPGDVMSLYLQLRERKESPPQFLELLKEIRDEERNVSRIVPLVKEYWISEG